MRNAYAILGVSFIIVFGTAYALYERAHAPSTSPETASQVTPNSAMDTLTLTSDVFEDGAHIPSLYTCDSDNINPPLTISGVPEEAESLVLVMDDPDIPAEVKELRGIEKFDHWVVYNLPADVTDITPSEDRGTSGQNSRGETGYVGPCPPPEYEPTTHRYVFRVYVLPSTLDFADTPTLDEVETAARENALASATLTGLYTRAE